MSKRLVQIAKELNVGTGSIVDFLAEKGFEIEDKPTAKVADEMYGLLVQEFKGSMAVKEQANKLVIGTSRQTAVSEESKKPPVRAEKIAEKPPVKEPVKEKEKPAEQVEETKPE